MSTFTEIGESLRWPDADEPLHLSRKTGTINPMGVSMLVTMLLLTITPAKAEYAIESSLTEQSQKSLEPEGSLKLWRKNLLVPVRERFGSYARGGFRNESTITTTIEFEVCRPRFIKNIKTTQKSGNQLFDVLCDSPSFVNR